MNEAQYTGKPSQIRKKIAQIWNGTANICGVLALIITVSWTFPSELWKAYFSNQERMQEGVQLSIKEMTTAYKEFASSQSLTINESMKYTLNTMISMQIVNELDKLDRYPEYIFNSASYAENNLLAGLAYQVMKYDAAIRFSKSAILAGYREAIEPQEAYVALGNALLGRDGEAAISEARNYYKSALQAAVKRKKTGRADYTAAPISVLIEISLSELKVGSWECGNLLASRIESWLSSPEFRNLSSTLAVFRLTRAAIVEVPGRPSFVCDYTDSLIPQTAP